MPGPEPATSLLQARPELIEVNDSDFRAVLTIELDELVFVGHYPGRPILPGVCLLEALHQAACAVAGRSGTKLELAAVESMRFLRPMLPPGSVELNATTTRQADQWTVRAVAAAADAQLAELILNYDARPM